MAEEHGRELGRTYLAAAANEMYLGSENHGLLLHFGTAGKAATFYGPAYIPGLAITSGGIGFPDSTVQMTADKGQTPWAQNVDAAGFALMGAGKVAIGTPTITTDDLAIGVSSGDASILLESNSSAFIKFKRLADQWWVGPGVDATSAFVFYDLAAGNRLVISAAGNVGIGPSSTPAYKLDVAGVINSSSGGFRFPDGTTQVTALTKAQAQTPWTQNVDAAGFDLTNAGQGVFNEGVLVASVNGLGIQGQTVAPGVNQLLRSSSDANLYTNWVHTIANDNGTAAITRVYASNDAYIRYYSLANFAAQIKPLAQTPWAQNVDAAGFRLDNAARINAAASAQGLPYTASGIEIRESYRGGDFGGDLQYAPRLTFHWSGIAARQIGMDANAVIRTFNQAGTGYEAFAAALIESKSGGFRFPDGTTQLTSASQTPWAQNVDAANYVLSNVRNVLSNDSVAARYSLNVNAHYFDSSWRYLATGRAGVLVESATGIDLYVAPTGSAGAPIPLVNVVTFSPTLIQSQVLIESKSGGFKFPDGTTQVTAASQTPWAQDVDAAGFKLTNGGQLQAASNNVSTDSGSAGITIREVNRASGSSPGDGPRLAFQWNGVTFRQLGVDTSGAIRTFDSAGTAYAPFAAALITANNGLVLLGLPTTATGPSGTVWRDAAAGNVLKIVP